MWSSSSSLFILIVGFKSFYNFFLSFLIFSLSFSITNSTLFLFFIPNEYSPKESTLSWLIFSRFSSLTFLFLSIKIFWFVSWFNISWFGFYSLSLLFYLLYTIIPICSSSMRLIFCLISLSSNSWYGFSVLNLLYY